MSKVDLYRVLNVSRNASLQEIKVAYRKLAIKFHPDTCQNMDRAQAEERFKTLVTAYQTLSDTRRRADYDVDQGYAHYTTSSQRHADWDPGRTYGQSVSSQRGSMQDFGDKYNAAEWYAAHYPTPNTRPAAQTDHTQGSSWMKTDSAHQRYFIRKQRGQKMRINLEEEAEEVKDNDKSSSSRPFDPPPGSYAQPSSDSKGEAKTPQEAARELHRKRMARIMQTKAGSPSAGPRGANGECTVS
eukprot:gene30379-36707_t